MSEMITFGAGAEESPLASVLAQLIGGNLEKKEKARLKAFQDLRSAIYFMITDVGVELLLIFKRGSLVIHSGKQSPPAISFFTDSQTLLELTNMNIKGGLRRILSDKNNRKLIRKMMRGELKIKGLLLHPLELLRLAKLLA